MTEPVQPQQAPYPPYQQQYPPRPPRRAPVTPALWVALAAFVFAVIFTVVGDNSIVISAGTPLMIGALAAAVAAVSAVVAIVLQRRTVVWSVLILVGALLVGVLAVYDYGQVQQVMDHARSCLQDLGSC